MSDKIEIQRFEGNLEAMATLMVVMKQHARLTGANITLDEHKNFSTVVFKFAPKESI